MKILGVQEGFLNLWALGIAGISGLPPLTVHMERIGVLWETMRDFCVQEVRMYILVRGLRSCAALGK